MAPIPLPHPRVLHHFPEASLLAVLDATLAMVELALREEHPASEDLPSDPEHDVPSSLILAHLVITRAVELRDLLQLYSASLRRAVHATDDDLF